MSVLKFLFVLLIILPIAVLMVYFINNLSGKVTAMAKRDAESETAGRSAERRSGRAEYGRRSYREAERSSLTGGVAAERRYGYAGDDGGRAYPAREGGYGGGTYGSGYAYREEENRERAERAAKRGKKRSRGRVDGRDAERANVSKRKRRKERKKNRKAREKK